MGLARIEDDEFMTSQYKNSRVVEVSNGIHHITRNSLRETLFSQNAAVIFCRSFAKETKKPRAKRAKTAYQFFCNEKRSEVISDDPSFTFGQISAELGKRWKALPAKDREPFVKMNEQAKAQLAKEVAAAK
ncbi:hypothetical protein CYMTET_27681 [Cymbomonas tetramitiformis]|uniref:HMG box domain-containing protein n=1 Tax=Cymbomonas tetramitiformis TaxID=36881 RepID=A0AAE0BWZ7_9CHLO|nr:hypothetical protein CYMTET_46035 [Cymbomonas tetramitiformis]KAK3263514.1 hypothetical protein CYMTET_27681 [Cymbomonas tetramitiformis]